MTAAAVNCLASDPPRKIVAGVTGAFRAMSASPYPRAIRVRPPRATATETPATDPDPTAAPASESTARASRESCICADADATGPSASASPAIRTRMTLRIDGVGCVPATAEVRTGRSRCWFPGLIRKRSGDSLGQELVEQRELRHRAKAHPMMPRGAGAAQPLLVRRRGVACVGLPAVAGVARREAPHECVTHRLGDDRGGGDRMTARVAADQRLVRVAELGQRQAV